MDSLIEKVEYKLKFFKDISRSEIKSLVEKNKKLEEEKKDLVEYLEFLGYGNCFDEWKYGG